MQGIEFEKKYQIQTNDWSSISGLVVELKPSHHFWTESTDFYYYPEDFACVLRYRFGENKSEFTYKSNVKGNFSLRKELNLFLIQENQSKEVSLFAEALGFKVGPEITKKIEVFDFQDAEVCIYEAKSSAKELCCVEIEAKNFDNIADAKEIVDGYEKKIGRELLSEIQINNFDFFKD